ncbi:hypothetical protein GCM10020358_80990 [Amorphoplanes nipponensis]|uniref:Uncharacterized protein n=1 Tax=Actinoplanes nipponensis TaxID=135950 RepID=A0A919MP88_9ACTN|nr:hypothetical protein [Actinoplanes nipponensis]GIE49263.1 hypothetical protein Ani05nite_27970 [Actinoplanes nipponensis]
MRCPHLTQSPIAGNRDVLRHLAEQVADCLADRGYAFVEEDRIEGLAATLGSFLASAGIPINPPDAPVGTPGVGCP